MKIAIPEYYHFIADDIDASALYALGDIIKPCSGPSKEQCPVPADADAILVDSLNIDNEFLNGVPGLKYVGECGTGYNNIDVDACKKRNIVVTNVPAYSTDSVAQHTIALILELLSRTGQYNSFVQEGGWISADTFSPFVIPTSELYDKTIGLIGYGQIARRVARISSAFGMHVIAYSRSILNKINSKEPCAGKDENVVFSNLDDLLKKSDIVSIHCPLNKDSEGMCDEQFFSKMKKGSYFINTSRGAIVDEYALASALKTGHISAAGLDVLTKEPADSLCPLLGLENCVITPHAAWAAKEARQRLVDVLAGNLKAFINGVPENII